DLNIERSSGLANQIMSLPVHIGWIPRLIYLFYVPFPNFSNMHQVFSSLAVVLQLFGAPGLLKSLASHKVPNELKVFFIILLLSVVVSTMTFRHVLMFLPFAIVLWVYGYKKKVFVLGFRYFLSVLVFIGLSSAVMMLFATL